MLNKEILNIFNRYVKAFDFRDKDIRLKFHHTYRVLEYAKQIGISLKLNERDMRLAQICALLHDIGRFEQIITYHTYDDIISIDHGKLGYDILKEGLINDFVADEKEQKIVLFAVLNHNKFPVPKTNDVNKFFTNIVRDADKMDILKEQALTVTDENPKVNKQIIDCLYKKEVIRSELVKTDVDVICKCLGFIFDINYKYTYKFILDEKIIENKIQLIEIYTNEDMGDLEEYLINYVKTQLKNEF